MHDVEEILNRELREVADGLRVPPLPVLSGGPPRRPWLPVLAAAAVLLVVLGVVAVVASDRGGTAPEPAPSPTPTEAPREIPTAAPTIPYMNDGTLFVDGRKVDGVWGYLTSGGDVWLAMAGEDGTWWWGTGPEPEYQIDLTVDSPPLLSPDGRYVAVLSTDNGGIVTVLDTADGSRLGSGPVELGNQTAGTQVHIRAVTDDGQVVVQGLETTVLWTVRGESSPPVDLTETAPGVWFHASTAAGLWVSDGEEGPAYLAELSDDGEVTQIGDLPGLDILDVSPGGRAMAWVPQGSLGGEAFYLDTIEVGRVDGSSGTTLTAPGMWEFVAGSLWWEDDEYLVSALMPGEDHEGPRPMARCSVSAGRCVLIDAP